MGRIACVDDLKRRNRVERLDFKDHPLYPRDHFPDRMVECILCVDCRAVIEATSNSVEAEDDTEDQFEFCVRVSGKATSQAKRIPIRFFIARRELFQKYRVSQPRYTCGHCGKCFHSREGVTAHLSSRDCFTINMHKKELRQQRIELIENKALSGSGHDLLTDYHSCTKPHRKPDLADFGNPFKLKAHKLKRMPPWLVFKAQRSSLYPEIYQSLKFRRGSQNRNHFIKVKDSEGYASVAEKRNKLTAEREERNKIKLEETRNKLTAERKKRNRKKSEKKRKASIHANLDLVERNQALLAMQQCKRTALAIELREEATKDAGAICDNSNYDDSHGLLESWSAAAAQSNERLRQGPEAGADASGVPIGTVPVIGEAEEEAC